MHDQVIKSKQKGLRFTWHSDIILYLFTINLIKTLKNHTVQMADDLGTDFKNQHIQTPRILGIEILGFTKLKLEIFTTKRIHKAKKCSLVLLRFSTPRALQS